jgi:phosphoenolpyruvate carboxykinase (ATP)
MTQTTPETSAPDLTTHGITPSGRVYANLSVPALYEHALLQDGVELAAGGPLVVETGVHTGRAPKDKFTVDEPGSTGRIWWGPVNQAIAEDRAAGLRAKLRAHLGARPALYVVDAYAGSHPAVRLNVRVITESPWHALFARTLFINPTPEELADRTTQAVVLHAPSFEADPAVDGTHRGNFVVLHPTDLEILIGGTRYAGEIKKSIFTLMNDRLPQLGVFPMHCSANVGDDGRSAIFFGLSGTGKTTLSADPERGLIGDDEHGWGDDGVFNIEGGCYAKVINLSPDAEPEIWDASHQFGAVLENVVIDPQTREMDLDDGSKTENTRSAYNLEAIPNAVPEKRAGHPSTVIMLTADAFGVLPPLAKLSREQAMDYFLVGYTAKVAGTEVGVVEPEATFSACFGAPFLPQPPKVYAEMLGRRLDEHGSSVWLVNTGWTGGSFGVGHRMPIAATRAIVRAALSGELDSAPTRVDPVFGLEVPTEVLGVAPELLTPRETWDDKDVYDAKARELAERIAEQAAAMRTSG